MRFASPWLLASLAVVPLLLRQHLAARPTARIRFSSLESLRRLPRRRAMLSRHALFALRLCAVTLLCLALGRPQTGRRLTEVSTEGVDIVLAIDTSGSMQALDFVAQGRRVTRLDAVRRVVGEFIQGRPGDRMGMVVFGSEAYTQCPLTLDHGILLGFLEQVKIGMAGDATALGSAIAVGTNRLKDIKAKSKVIVLLTDGKSNAGEVDPLAAADAAAALGVKVYTIGAGTDGKAPFQVDTLFGPQLVYRQADLDEETLQKIADRTGARFFRAQSPETLKAVYDTIDKLEKSDAKVKEYVEYKERFAWLALPALLLLLSEVGLGQTRWRKLP